MHLPDYIFTRLYEKIEGASTKLRADLERIERIHCYVQRVRRNKEEARAEYDGRLKEIDNGLKSIQKDCKHEWATRPTAECDTICQICGAEV